ncbi:MAG: DNA polymerase III subunit epsilon [Ancylobacter novellus]|uniref:DNA polymerase III subunit epsilon n=1 Tax=Ancylobacter novellus TaxID=921 RepID=A0A2W5M9X8_ANCNO|nr:MAG: DNA polymerase III subunit epsilon [Ancylobacter novellus]
MREIVLDTETTGLDPATGDRVVEIGCVELLNRIPTGASYHIYINPERDMPDEAFRVHGLSSEFLSDKPRFAEIADEFLAFIDEDALVIHNASFDMGFLNAELSRLGKPKLGRERVVDTLMLARRKNPGGQNSLDALCARYGIDNSKRTKHGALLDSEILAEVYLELLGGRQATLGLSPLAGRAAARGAKVAQRPTPLAPRLTAEEVEAHLAFVASLGGAVIWREYLAEPDASPAA